MSASLVRMADILPSQEAIEAMARRRYQRPNVLTSTTKRPYFYFRYRAYSPSGEKAMQREQFIGWSDEISKKRAKELRDEWLKGVNNVPLVLQSQVQFTDFIVIWRRTHADGLKPRTRMQYASALKCHILPKFGKLRLCDIDREVVQEWKVGLAATMLPDSARNEPCPCPCHQGGKCLRSPTCVRESSRECAAVGRFPRLARGSHLRPESAS